MYGLNEHLVDFIDDELQNNNYYESVREFANGREWRPILSAVCNAYEDAIDNFGPYRFLDAIEDYLRKLKEENNPLLTTAEDLDEIIDEMWDKDFFENYWGGGNLSNCNSSYFGRHLECPYALDMRKKVYYHSVHKLGEIKGR